MRATLVLASLFLLAGVMAQPIRTKWIKHDYGFEGPTPDKIVQLANGDYVVGYSSVEGPPRRAVLICYAPNGAIRWNKTIWTGDVFSGFDFCRLLPSQEGSVYVVGTASEGTGSFGRKTYLAHIGASGGTLWARTYGTNELSEDAVFWSDTLIVAGSKAGQPYVAQYSNTGGLLRSLAREKPGFYGNAGPIIVDKNGRMQIGLYASNNSSWQNGIWTVPPDFLGDFSTWYSDIGWNSFALADDGTNFYSAGTNLQGGLFAGSYIEKRTQDQTLIWRKVYPERQSFSSIKVDVSGKLVAYTGPLNRDMMRFDSSGSLLSTVTIGDQFASKFFLDKYGRHYLVGSALISGFDELQLQLIRGTQWTGVETNYLRRDSSGEGYFVQDTSMNQSTGDICVVATGYGPSIICLQQAPEALADAFRVRAGMPFVSPRSVLYNDRFAAGATVTAISLPTHGTVDLENDGRFIYTPNAGFTGTDSFSYRVAKPGLTPSLATVSLVVE